MTANVDGVPEKFATLGLTYDDVLLLPGASDMAPDQIDTASYHLEERAGEHPAALRGDGQGHRVPHGDRHGPAGRRRVSCTATSPSPTRPTRSTW